jgi:hypothetical protein
MNSWIFPAALGLLAASPRTKCQTGSSPCASSGPLALLGCHQRHPGSRYGRALMVDQRRHLRGGLRLHPWDHVCVLLERERGGLVPEPL